MAVVEIEIRANVAVIQVDNPPVNAISSQIRSGLVEAIEQIEDNNAVDRAILICRGRTFMAGADVREFSQQPQPPHLPEVTAAIEASHKPVTAVIHGQSLGGGLEIALACHYRIALAGSRLGLPEVKLGLLPGAGGTQRLPRLLGAEAALSMIVSGDPVSAEKALESGLIDGLCQLSTENPLADLFEYALDFAQHLDLSETSHRRLSLRSATAPNAGLYDQWRERYTKRQRGVDAPQACIDAIEAATSLPFDQGIARERELFLSLRGSDQSQALQHLFFAERRALRNTGVGTAQARPINCVAIIGAGTMGTGIAMSFANAGIPVTLLEIDPQALARGMDRIASQYAATVKRGKCSQDEAEQRRELIQGTTDYAQLARIDLVIEAVFEKLEVKQQVFEQLDRHCKPDAILATNTSYLDINQIAAVTSRPQQVLGLHFFSPANIMKLVEVIKADRTSDVAMSSVLQQLKRLGKVSVTAGVCHGFIGNRMYQSYQREVGLLMLEGAKPSQIDNALYQFGMAMGPLAVADLSGLDIGYLMRRSLDESKYEQRAFLIHDRLVESDRKGRKSGAGFYRYDASSTANQDDPEVLELIKTIATEQGVEQRSIDTEEIVQRCMLALINEAGHILDEGIAASAADIDLVYCHGYGFPKHRGGPMQLASCWGLAQVEKQIDELARTQGPRWWNASKSLRDAAQKNSW
ncbi:3-hydroxyacyl-CoA dehydrogenase [Motiliproteus coralliicola]|uniref:3-hydroxyacyl-CoA dehydrogenase n=1 Tax=Motiliproteus coralliicola TaxID=2283196 RepID=A0A369WSI7_9GAMM|nr:3-hydroxyacyl-CoA dehydrogenase NAD-binding domain-containing protein [Motiliproteus coralliicola]RDE24637.1 3-hydroxyacyl-CoA dehydrogenase [Motiliproteus coralliicola]